ncbi:MAG: CotH kinase family protein [Verrucomicrobia bacterium]|nr:CotH kinase family protein [Verrucomicrobiota bacterium]
MRRLFLLSLVFAPWLIAIGAEDAPARAKPVPALDLFEQGVIPRVRIELSDDNMERLRKSPRRYVPGTVVETTGTAERRYTNVAIRLKGGPGSFRTLDEQPAFTVNFDRLAPGQTFHGLKKLHLNNSVQDSSLLAEKLCREMFEAAGVPAPRAGHAFVTLNKRRLGTYVLIEGVNKQFLKRHFADASGNVYDGHSRQDVAQRLEVNSGENPKDQSRLAALAAAVRVSSVKERRAALEKVLDIDRFISFMAAEVITAHWDGYSLGVNNFRIFHDKATDRMVFLPQGLDQTFQRKEIPAQPDMKGLVAKAVMEVPEYRARFRAREVELLTNTFLVDPWVKRLREVAARVRVELAEVEPSKAEEYIKRAASYRRRIQQRLAVLRQELKLEPTETIAARKADTP